VARFVDDDAEDGMWVQAVPVWALMQDVEGRTWVAGIDVIGEGAGGRPCDEMGNFHDYLFQPDRSLPMPGQQSSEGRSPEYVIQRVITYPVAAVSEAVVVGAPP
jgi:hypothetical protein